MNPADTSTLEQASSISGQAREQEKRWLAALDDDRVRAKGLGAEAVRPALAAAQARVLERLLQVMIHEQLVGGQPAGPPVTGRLVVPLTRSGRSLVVECSAWRGHWLLQRFGRAVVEDGMGTTLIERPAELIAVLAAEMGDGDDKEFARFALEVGDSALNDGLCAAYRSAWNRRIEAAVSAVGADGFWAWLSNGHANVGASLFLEQWSAVGHPYNPRHKTKLKLKPREIVTWSPEFEGRVLVRLAAVRRPRVHVETMPGSASIEERLEQDLPEWLAAWRVRLRAGGLAPDDFVPLPVHPWQADKVLPTSFAAAIDAGDVTLLDGPEMECAPTMSFRTVVPQGRADMPHIKLPVAMRLTSTMRTISPRSCEMGPRISWLLQDILAGDPAFDGRLTIVPEEIGIHYQDEDGGELGKQLGVLIRPNPERFTAADEILVPAAALLLLTPGTDLPLFVELAKTSGATSPDDIRRAYRAYAEALLGSAIRLYLVYGIGFGAHQQNTLAVFGADGGLRRVMIRDFGGIRIHRPTLWRTGRRLQLHPDRLTVVESRDGMRSLFQRTVLLHHLSWLGATLAGNSAADARGFWMEIAQTIEGAFDAARGDVPDDLWRSERRAFLDDDWQLKSNARMRITQAAQDIYFSGPNPLAAVRDSH